MTNEIIHTATLQDGSKVTIRFIHPEDARRLQMLHSRLSEESLLFRFLGHPKVLSDEQAHDLANVDYKNTMAFVAILPEENDERLVGVARYSMIPSHEKGHTEAAIVIEDKYQRLGLGMVLAEQLIPYARKHGVKIFINFIDPENTGVIHLMRRCGLTVEIVGRDSESLEVHVDLTERK